MAWSAEQYVKFENERTRPARDLLDQISSLPDGPLYDLGCGPGNSTELIRDRFPAYMLTGIDSDDNMLSAAGLRLTDVTFEKGDLTHWAPQEPAALFFANAVFQWLPQHPAIFDRLMDDLVPGGVLAIQMPDNLDEPTHLIAQELAEHPKFAPFFDGVAIRRNGLPKPAAYLDGLVGKSGHIDVWHTVYYHRLADAEAIVEWVKGTGLRPYLDALSPQARQDYLADYLDRIRASYPPLADGRVLLRFPRLFILAVKS